MHITLIQVLLKYLVRQTGKSTEGKLQISRYKIKTNKPGDMHMKKETDTHKYMQMENETLMKISIHKNR